MAKLLEIPDRAQCLRDVPKAGAKWLFLIEATHRDCAMHLPNPLHPSRLSSAERRAEVCAILARGLLRLHARAWDDPSDRNGDFPLHSPADQSGHATPTHKETA